MPGRMMRRNGQGRLDRHLRACERSLLEVEIARAGGNTTLLARRLGICRRALFRRLDALGLAGTAADQRTCDGISGPRGPRPPGPPPTPAKPITQRERDAAELFRQGKSLTEIKRTLDFRSAAHVLDTVKRVAKQEPGEQPNSTR